MSNCPTAPTSTTASSPSCPSPAKSTQQQDCWARDGRASPGPAAPPKAAPGGVLVGRQPVQAGSLLGLARDCLDRRSASCWRRAKGQSQRPITGRSTPPLIIACGALGAHLREIIARRGWRAELHTLPAVLHNRPNTITDQAERLARAALARGQRVAVAYADCGTYGALDGLCARLGLRRLPGLHCYDVFAGPDRMRAVFEAEPGTYVLTDFLVRSFRRTVLAELGLDRYPELWPDYFGHYRRLVWLAQNRDPALEVEAARVAARFGLPLTVIETGTGRLERELESLIHGDDGAMTRGRPPAGSQP